MASGQEHAALRSVRTLFSAGAVGGMSDGQLLERFVGRRGGDSAADAAFGALVERHGPMVLGVCRGVLKDAHDSEDAFQATFLVLVRKGGSIRNLDSLGSWLCGVAHRVAVRAKAGDARRRHRERQGAERPAEQAPHDESRGDHLEALHDEVARLPEQYRAPVVLCYLEGLTYEMAARHLRVSEDTVRGRLARARGLLRTRLTRRGAALPCALAGLAMFPGPSASASAMPSLPSGLMEFTVRAASRLVAGEALSGVVPANVAALTKGVLRTMLWYKLKVAAVPVMAIGAVAFGTGLHAQQDSVRARLSAESAQAEPRRGQADDAGREGRRTGPGRPDELEAELARLVPGRIVRDSPVTKDCMVLSYLPDWAHGDVDNIGVANNDGGVRTLLKWRDVHPETTSSGLRFYLALYARKTTSNGPPGSILAFPLRGDWPERTSWKTLPEYDADPAATYKFVPGTGWKVFDITPVLLARAESGSKADGVLLRFLQEDRSGSRKDWSGYEFVSREGTGGWTDRRPVLLVVKPDEP